MLKLYTTERRGGRPGFDRREKRWFNPVTFGGGPAGPRGSGAGGGGKELAP
jgi:hypothetical protein